MAAVKNPERTRYNASKLTPDQVLMILTRKEMTLRQLAEITGVSFSTIQKVWQGKSHLHVHPDIPRRPRSERSHASQCAIGPRCGKCVHDHRGTCSLEFPERMRNGEVAAVHCSAYTTGRVL
jgi:hypothetical protein